MKKSPCCGNPPCASAATTAGPNYCQIDPRRKPWVNLDGADVVTIMGQLIRCPSGALSMKLPPAGD